MLAYGNELTTGHCVPGVVRPPEEISGLLWKQCPSPWRFGTHQRRLVVVSGGTIAWSLPDANNARKGFLDFSTNLCTVKPVEGSDVKFELRPVGGRWTSGGSFTTGSTGDRVFCFDVTDSGYGRDKWLRVIQAQIDQAQSDQRPQPKKKNKKKGAGRLRFEDDPEELDAASSAVEGESRPVRERVNTGFERDVAVVDDGPKPRFRETAEVLDAAATGTEGPKRDVRNRINTGFVNEGESDGPKFADAVEEFDAASNAAATGSKRNVRGRVNTGFAKESAMPDEGAGEGGDAAVRFGGTSVHDAASPSSSGPQRSVRDRINTGFAKETDLDSGGEDSLTPSSRISKQRSMGMGPLLTRTASVEQAADVKRRLQGSVIRHGKDGILPRDSPEAGIETRLVKDAKKDSSMLKKALKPLALFENVEDEHLDELTESMNVFGYADKELVVREGDGGGSYFFVISQGVFEVLVDDKIVCEKLTQGSTFGESVLLVDGKRTASVRAKGAAQVCALEADDVREVLRCQYDKKHKDAMLVVESIIGSGSCDQFEKLNAFQLHKLYVDTKIEEFADGALIAKEGQGQLDEVWVLAHGAIVLRQAGRDHQRLPRGSMFGMRGLLFGDTPFSGVVDGSAKCLVISRQTLQEVFGTARMATVLMRSVVSQALNGCSALSKLYDDQRDGLMNAFDVMPLKSGEVLQVDDLRFVMCLHDQVEVSEDGFKKDIQLLKASENGQVGMEQLLNKDLPWQFQVRGASIPISFVAVWHADDVNNILAKDEVKEKLRVLKTIYLFNTLSKNQLRKLAISMETEKKEDAEVIVTQGDMGNTFYIIGSGRVAIEKNGRFIRALQAGDYFGEIALLTKEPRSATISAAGACVIWKMSHNTFKEVMPAPMLKYLRDRISLLDTEYGMADFEFRRVIGTGGFGVVKMVRNKKGNRYALKCVKKQPIVELGQQETLINERSVLADIDHPYIIRLVQSFRNEVFVYFLLELVTGGELLEALALLGILNKSQAQFYIVSILEAFQHLHERRIVYLDLKSENVLIDSQGYIKIVDFGLATKISGGVLHAVRGTPHFMCPEMILHRGYDTTADLWAVGVCLFEFMVGHLPFGKDCTTKSDIFKEVLKAPLVFPESFQQKPWYEESASVIRSFLQREPTRRLGSSIEGFDAIFAHTFFAGYDFEGLHARQNKPPYIPKQEHYTENAIDKDVSGMYAGKSGQNLAKLEQDILSKELASGWKDPNPGWDEEFE